MDEDKVVNSSNVEQETELDYKAEYLKLQETLKIEESKKRQLLSEKKAEEAKRRAVQQTAEEEKLKQSGDTEALLKSYQQKLKESDDRFNQLQEQLTKKEIRQKAIEIANDLKPLDKDAADILADYIEKRIKLSDGGMLFLDKDGHASVMDADSLKNEFKNSNKFKPLIIGSQATGGGAPGNTGKTTYKSEMTRGEFGRLTPKAQFDYAAKVRAGQANLVD